MTTTSRTTSRPTSRPTNRSANRRTPPRRRSEAEPRCVRCDERVLEIHMVIDGRRLTMRSCTNCDHRGWVQDGVDVELAGVLSDLTDTKTRFVRDYSAS